MFDHIFGIWLHLKKSDFTWFIFNLESRKGVGWTKNISKVGQKQNKKHITNTSSTLDH